MTKQQRQALPAPALPCSTQHPLIHICTTLFKHSLCIGHLGVAFKASHNLAPVYLPAHRRLLCLHHVGPPESSSPGLEVGPRWLCVVGEEPAKARSWLSLPQGRDSTQSAGGGSSMGYAHLAPGTGSHSTCGPHSPSVNTERMAATREDTITPISQMAKPGLTQPPRGSAWSGTHSPLSRKHQSAPSYWCGFQGFGLIYMRL